MSDRIKCPYCKEEIIKDAIKCRYCAEDLTTRKSQWLKYQDWYLGLGKEDKAKAWSDMDDYTRTNLSRLLGGPTNLKKAKGKKVAGSLREKKSEPSPVLDVRGPRSEENAQNFGVWKFLGIFALVITLGLSIMVGIAVPYNTAESEQQGGEVTETQRKGHRCSTAGRIPRVEYKILNAVRKVPFKLRMDVMLQRKLSEAEILQLACFLKEKELNKYAVYFFFFAVEGMSKDTKPAWAICHFNPSSRSEPLSLSILGFKKGEEQKFTNWSQKKGALIGMWVKELGTPRVQILFEKGGNYFLETRFKQGTLMVEEVTWDGQRIEEKGGNQSGEYFKVLPDNRLGFYGENGLFATAKPVEPEAGE